MPYNGQKARAPRKNVSIPARMRGSSNWADVHIKNVSLKGLMAEMPNPPSRGRYIEIRRGTHILVGAVVWSRGSHFGVSLSDAIDVEGLAKGVTPANSGERRNSVRRSEKTRALVLTSPSDWRWLGKAFERVSLTLVGATLAFLAASMVFETVDSPMQVIGTYLGN
ncbi:MAG: PilZ domain-containing protein [Sphingomonadaceae bacterium]